MRFRLSSLAAAVLGLAISTGYPAGMVAAISMPALVFRQPTRRAAFRTALLYYGCAIWPVIPGARNFFGSRVSALAAVALWCIVTAALTCPWAALWSPKRTQILWRIPTVLVVASVPPIGIIGWASPLTAAGFLFPATGWIGLLACVAIASGLGVFPRSSGVCAVLFAILANAIHPHSKMPPLGWKAVNTTFGAVAHSTLSPGAEYQIAEAIQQRALSDDASVMIFPETVVPFWTAATDQFWQPALNALRAQGKTILVGALVPRPGSSRAVPQTIEFSAEITALKSGVVPFQLQAQQLLLPDSGGSYFNDLVIRGTDFNTFRQRIPVPIAMWNPFSGHGAPMNALGSGILRIREERAAVLICYEQLLVWPVLSSMARRPTIVVAIANDHWAANTSIPFFQKTAVRAWSRLFGIPHLFAVNF